MSKISLEDARLPLERAAVLLALSDGLCQIGALRANSRAGQFSIFNFLLRCAEEPEQSGGRPAYVTMMRAGIMRRRTWYCRYWLPNEARPLRIEIPAPLARGWQWWEDVEEIRRRLSQSPTWLEAVGDTIDARIAHFQSALGNAELIRS